MNTPTFPPQILPPWVRSLAAGVPEAPENESPLPPAPTGTMFALGEELGWAVPPRPFELLFGRDEDNVNIPLGVRDKRISRVHGRIVCHGTEWTMRNEGQLPMLFPGDAMLLSGQERLIEDAYTPVYIGDLSEAVHCLEIRLIGGRRDPDDAGADDETVPPNKHPLSEVECLVLTSLAQRYLRGLPHPQPVAWRQVADDMRRSNARDERNWNDGTAARVVAAVRERLSHPEYRPRVAGLLRDEVFGEPLGNALNDNLIRALLQSTTLDPTYLDRLDLGDK
ncbi:FHA domain-containing protein [Glycomyces buryatensis]|uniref:FHA domain-containing protein n=1 Tax=Glycomyces buryatensis TaxID=2570927 RepID=A0A4S8QI47_9ACTN|nr:FHA domain-containing protein [Glycomyces buryatensis]THV43421.1 FHA domain-containing protein [Glycomyces buryatensis]